MQCASHLSALMVLRSGSKEFQWKSRYYISSNNYLKTRLFQSHGSRDLRIRRRLVGPVIRSARGHQKAKPRIRAKSTSKVAKLDPKIGSRRTSNRAKTIFSNFQTHQTVVFLPHQPAKVTRTTSIMEPSLIEPTSVTICPTQVHRSQHNCSLKCQINLGTLVGGNTHENARDHTDDLDSWWRRWRPEEMPNHQVSAKPKPFRGFCLLQRKGWNTKQRKKSVVTKRTLLTQQGETWCDHTLRQTP